MHDSYLLLLLVLSTNAVRRFVISNSKANDGTIQNASRAEAEDTSVPGGLKNLLQEKNEDNAKNTKPAQENVGTPEKDIIQEKIPFTKMPWTTTRINENIGRSYFHLDPVFDSLKNRRLWQKAKKRKTSSSSGSDSDIEMQFWLEDWEDLLKHNKMEAMNSSKPRGEVLNMKMARPSGIPCGDPNQHDLPWGTCMRPGECEEEYRIHRGDISCGRSQYVCCSFVDTTYDMYQAPDLSFEHDNSLTTDSDIEKGYRDTHEEKKLERLRRKHEKRKLKRTKVLLKKKIRQSITKIITEITKLLQRAYRNSTSLRMTKAKILMNTIKDMKKLYRKDRDERVRAHEFDIFRYELELESSLNKIRGVNEAFMANATFRDIVINGTINQQTLNTLQRTHPVLSLFFKNRRMGGDFEPEQTEKEEPELEKEELDSQNKESQIEKEELGLENEEPQLEEERSESEEDEPEPEKAKPKVIDYDVEYGVLYY